jgi:hypothetical protein
MKKEELQKLSISLWEKLRRAIEDGDKASSLNLVEEIKTNEKKMRSILMRFIDFSLTRLAETTSEDSVYKVMRDYCINCAWPLFGDEFPRLNHIEKLKRRVAPWTILHNIENLEIEEDDDKYTIKFPCDTGGVLAGIGKGKAKKAHPWSFGEKDVGYYCTHCHTSFEVMAIEQCGHPWWVTFPPKNPEDKCVQYIYKDIEDTPEEYYIRAGGKKPKKKESR